MSASTQFPPVWVFFDLDDTLWDFSGNSLIALESVFSTELSLQLAFGMEKEFIEVYHKHNAELWNLYHSGKITAPYLRAERFGRTLAESSFRGDIAAEARRLDKEYLSRLVKEPGLVDGAVRLLEGISPYFLIGLLSNGFLDTQYDKIYNTPLHKYVARTVISEETGINKPDRRIFDYALRETGAEASRTIMVGDNPATDIKGALDAGWNAIYLDMKGAGADGLCLESPRLRCVASLAEAENALMDFRASLRGDGDSLH